MLSRLRFWSGVQAQLTSNGITSLTGRKFPGHAIFKYKFTSEKMVIFKDELGHPVDHAVEVFSGKRGFCGLVLKSI